MAVAFRPFVEHVVNRPFKLLGLAKMKAVSVAFVVLLVAGTGTAVTPAAQTVESFSLREYPIPALELPPGPIVTDPRGGVWFAEEAGQRIAELRANGTYRLFDLRNEPSQIQSLAMAGDGTLWFTETFTMDGSHNWIGKITPHGRVVTYSLPRSEAFLGSIASAGANGVWVSEMEAHRVARVRNSGEIREFPLPGPKGELVRSLVAGADGSVWVAQDDAFVHLYPTGRAQRFPVRMPAAGDGIRNMVRATASSLWMTLYTQRGERDAIWRFTPPNAMMPYAYSGSEFGAILLVSGQHGDAWFPELGGRAIDHIDASGNVVRHPIPLLGSDIMGMSLSDNGGLWFTNMQSEKLGYFGDSRPNPSPILLPLSVREQSIIKAWRGRLQPREAYDMSTVTADTLSVALDFAIVGWSDLDGNAATLLHNDEGRWQTTFVTNGNFDQVKQLTEHGVPKAIATQLLKDSNVRLVPSTLTSPVKASTFP